MSLRLSFPGTTVMAVIFATLPCMALFGGGNSVKSNEEKFPTGQPVTPPDLHPSGMVGNPPPEHWESVGPGSGGSQYLPTFAPYDPNTAIISNDMGGQYLTTDGGASWNLIVGLPGSTQAAFHPFNDKVVMLGGGNGVQRSEDGGKTWRVVSADSGARWPQRMAHAVIFDPDYPDVYAWCSMGNWEQSLGFGIQYSTNGGKSFTKAAGACAGRFVWILAVDPATPKEARQVLGATTKGLIISGDCGKTWRELDSWKFGEVTSVCVLSPPSRNRAVYLAATRDGVYRSRDRGKSWEKIASVNDTMHSRRNLAASTYYDKKVYATAQAGIWVSDDGGVTFHKEGMSIRKKGWHEVVRMWGQWGKKIEAHDGGAGCCSGAPETAIAISQQAAFITHDGGKNWDAAYSRETPQKTYISAGLEVTTSYGVVYKPDNPLVMLLTFTDIGMHRSEDGGRSSLRSLSGLTDNLTNTVYQAVFDPDKPNKAWIAVTSKHDLPYKLESLNGGRGQYFHGAVAASTDAGKSWSLSSDGLSDNPVTSIVLDKDSPPGKRRLFAALFSDGVYRSEDDGRHWERKSSGIPKNVYVWRLFLGPTESAGKKKFKSLYVTVTRAKGTGLYRSDDYGENWEKVADFGMPYDIAVDPTDANRLYLTNEGGNGGAGFLLSEDRGKTWRLVQAGGSARGITINPHESKTVYFCARIPYISLDGGKTFEAFSDFPTPKATRVTIDETDPGAMWVATFGTAYWRGPAKPGGSYKRLRGTPPKPAASYASTRSTKNSAEPLKLNFAAIGKLPEPDPARAKELKENLLGDVVSAMEDGFEDNLPLEVFQRIQSVSILSVTKDSVELELDEDILDLTWEEIGEYNFRILAKAACERGTPEQLARYAEYLAVSGDANAFRKILESARKSSKEHAAAVEALLGGTAENKDKDNVKTGE